MSTKPVVVIGSGLTGLAQALLLARAGIPVTVLERDPAAPTARPGDAWPGWERPGVSQFRHPHLMLPRWHQTMQRELPDLLEALLACGGEPVNLLHLQPPSTTHGWRPGDEDFDTVAVRRPELEACLARYAQSQTGVTVHRGVHVTGLLCESPAGAAVPRVDGVCTTSGKVAASLVIDASGRRTPVPRWVQRLGAAAPEEIRAGCGLVYWSRHFRTLDGRRPPASGPVLTHHGSMSVLTLPGDRGTFSVALVGRADDHHLRGLRHADAWDRVADLLPVTRDWVRSGRATTGVVPIAGIEDVTRSYVLDGRPLVTGLVAVGDAAVATDPTLGRGAALGVMQAVVVRDAAIVHGPGDPALVAEADAAGRREVRPWVEATTWFDRHRLAEMGAHAAGGEYRTDDLGWGRSQLLRRGASSDPALARASARIGCLLALPPDVLGDPAVAAALERWRQAGGDDDPRWAGPTRAELVEAARPGPVAVGPGR